jgi:hypothetical protein
MIDPEVSVAPPPTTDRVLRQFAGLWMLVLGGLAGWHWFAGGHRTLALVAAGLGLLVGTAGLARPSTIRPLFGGLMTITYPIGWLVSHVVLTVLFLGVFTPIAVLFRLIGRDALVRRRPPDVATYWRPRPMPDDVRSYFRQS